MALSHFRGHDIDDIFNEMIQPFSQPFFGGALQQPSRNVLTRGLRGIPTDFAETEKSFVLKADMPGIDKGDIQLDVEGDVISFGVEKKSGSEETKEEGGWKMHRVERSSQFQKRAMRLPENADLDKVDAKYEDGVLTIDIPKKEVKPSDGTKRIAVA